MNNLMYFELQADDISRAKGFYESVFSWKFIAQAGLPVEYWRIETEGIAGGLLPRPTEFSGNPGSTNAAVISMEVDDFDMVAERILQAGGMEFLPKFAVPGRCWQGYFLDTEANEFGIFQVDETAR